MKRPAVLGLLFMLLLGFVFLPFASAESRCETNVHTEQNGVSKDFHVTDCNESIDYESEDGSIRVKINNDTSTTINGEEVTDEAEEEVLSETDEWVEEVKEDGDEEEASNPTPSPTKSKENVLDAKVEVKQMSNDVDFSDEEILTGDSIFLSLVSVLPSPFSSVQKLFSLIQSAVYLI